MEAVPVSVERATSAGAPGAARRREVRPGVVYSGVLVLLMLATRMFVLEPHLISSASMAPTLAPGDVVIANKLGPSVGVHSGDIVTLPSPDGNGRLIKRVVATGGQSVGLYGGELIVDGNVVDEPHINRDQLGGIFFGPVTVPAGQVFLMGDNRLESVDSRQFGAVDAAGVDATVLLVLPFGHPRWHPPRLERVPRLARVVRAARPAGPARCPRRRRWCCRQRSPHRRRCPRWDRRPRPRCCR